MPSYVSDDFHRELENLRSMIEGVERSVCLIDASLVAFESFERGRRTDSTSRLDLKMRRDNLASTLATLRGRLESMQRTLAFQ